MGKIKVLHVIKSLGRGGAEVLLPETLKLHNNSKFEFHYIYFLPWKDQMVSSIKEAGGKIQCFPASNNLTMLKQFKSVTQYCKQNNIDGIHSHLPWSGFLGRMIHRSDGIPVIYTEHNIQERYHIITRLLNKYSFNFQSRALGVSQDVTDSIRSNIRLKIPVETLLNGVNTNFFMRDSTKGAEIRKKYDIPQNKIVIGNIAVFREQKDLTTWVKAFQRIGESHPDVYGLLVGAGPQEKHIKNLVNECGLESRIIFTGLQTDTISFFSAMDIFMMSSAFEGLPIALLEAMSMNCAVVSTRAGGVREVIRENMDGLLCEPEDDETLAELAGKMIVDDQVRQKFQVSARKRVKESFSLENMVKSLENIYEEVFVKNDH